MYGGYESQLASGLATGVACADSPELQDAVGEWRTVTGGGPWLTVVEAARHAGWRCANGRAPASFYELAQRIGVKLSGKWRIHRDDLDAEMRRHRVPTR